MPKRKRFRDKHKAGKSDIIRYKPGEDWNRRHQRRLNAALEHRKELEAWCKLHGLRLTVTNNTHHWQLLRGERVIAEWWPSTAKLVIDKRYRHGIHCHDWQQVRGWLVSSGFLKPLGVRSMSTVTIQNVGPIENLTLPIPEEGGVVVLVGANGSGKTHTLDAVQSLASGKGSLPVRDGALRGAVEGFGARIGISRTSRRTGELEVTTLTGKLDIGELIEPGLKDPAAADAKRIKALASLSGVKVTADTFTAILGGTAEVEAIVPPEVFKHADPVAIVEGTKRAIEAHARQAKSLADHEAGHAQGCAESVRDVVLPDVIDNEAIQSQYTLAVQAKQQLEDLREAWKTSRVDLAELDGRITAATEEYAGELSEEEAERNITAERRAYLDLEATDGELQSKVDEVQQQLDALLAQKRELSKSIAEQTHKLDQAVERAKTAKERKRRLDDMARNRYELDGHANCTDEELEAAAQAVAVAREAIEHAAIASRAADKLADAAAHQKVADEALAKHDQLREAAAACDEVLSTLVGSKQLRVQAGRLVLDTDRGEEYFSDLSDGERVKIAVDIAVDRLHELGQKPLLVLPQRNWQDLDIAARKDVAAHARERGVVIITAECTGGELRAEEFAA